MSCAEEMLREGKRIEEKNKRGKDQDQEIVLDEKEKVITR